MRRQPRGTKAVREPHAAGDFHGAGNAPFPLGEELRRFLLLYERGGHDAQAEIDRERQPDRTRADDENLRVDHGTSASENNRSKTQRHEPSRSVAGTSSDVNGGAGVEKRPGAGSAGKSCRGSCLVMAGLVPAIPIVERHAILIEIAGDKPRDDASRLA